MTGLTFLIMFLLLMTLVAVVPQILRRLHIPGVVAVMLIGIIIGPNALDLIRRLNHFLGRGYPTAQIYIVLEAMGLLGLVFLMALAGMEVNLRILRAEKKGVFWLSALTFAIPAAAGYAAYAVFEPGDSIGKWVYASLFASHSVGIVFPVIRELKVARTRFGVAVLASTVVTDIASLVLLAICVQLKRHEIPERVAGSISVFDHLEPGVLGAWFPALFVAVILLYIAGALWLVPVVARGILARLHPHDDTRLTFFLAGVLVVVFVGELIGISVIVGAFIAGMAVVRAPAFHDQGRILHKKIEGIGYGFVIPFLFLTIGMKTDLRILFAAWENAAIVLVTLGALIASKVGSGWLALRLAGFTNKKGLCAGLMTVPQLSATLAAATVAVQLQMIGPEFFNAIVCLSVVTTIPVPTLVKLLIVKGNIQFDQAEDLLGPGISPDMEQELG
ncbi:MAG TPA: cation:proton antiporter [Phycisphaerae bacterium]|nr:cation:proton antiporter [Phycisphaerae bacterium]HQL73943.1 cation:proton antiporter [Phycisphaerae bacterium]